MSIDSHGRSAGCSLPKYAVTRDLIAAQIYRGQFRTGDKIPPVKELMRLYGVSFSTVTRALAELEQAGLIDRRWGQGTFVRERRPTTQNIAVTFDSRYSITHPRRVRLCRGLSGAAHTRGFHLQMFPLIDSTIFQGESDLLLRKLLKEGDIAGLIGCSPHPPADIQRLAALNIPLVTVNHEYPGTSSVHVGLDAAQTADLVVSHLTELGHQKLGLIMAVPPDPAAQRIRASQRLAAALFDRLEGDPRARLEGRVVFSDYDWQSTEPRLRAWLNSSERPTALFCLEENLTMHTIELAHAMGLRVPEDLSVMGMGALAHRAITTVRPPSRQMGKRAMAILIAMLAGQRPSHQLFKCSLSEHGTTGAAPNTT